MTSQDDLLNAISLNSAVFNTARVLGPGVAGLLVAAVGEGVCFLINGISFMAVIAGLLMMRLPKFEPRAPIHLGNTWWTASVMPGGTTTFGASSD